MNSFVLRSCRSLLMKMRLPISKGDRRRRQPLGVLSMALTLARPSFCFTTTTAWERTKHVNECRIHINKPVGLIAHHNFFRLSSSTAPVDGPLASSFWEDDEGDREIVDEEGSSKAGEDVSLQEYEVWSRALDKCIDTLGKKRRSLESELEKAKGVEGTVARAQLLVSNLYLFTPGVKTAVVQDWEQDGMEVELTLNPKYRTATEETDALFALSRRLKRGSTVVTNLLETTSEAWTILEAAQLEMQSSLGEDGVLDTERFAIVQGRLSRTSRKTGFKVPAVKEDDKSDQKKKTNKNNKPAIGSPASNLRKLLSPGGCTVLVGRNRRGNEHLSLSIARGNDIWFHSRGCPGAHVLVFNRRGGPKPTDSCLQFAADLAIFYSDLRNEAKAPVSAAEPKHLLKPRGAPLGAIKVREEWKTFIGRPNEVPADLKLAREGSGQSDEYRKEDKAKRRKRTKRAADETRAKRRQANKERKRTVDEDFF